jgi:hypothetical protein
MGSRKGLTQNTQQGGSQIVPPIAGGTQQYPQQQAYNPYGTIQYQDYQQPGSGSLIQNLSGIANTGQVPSYAPPPTMSGPLQVPQAQPALPFTGQQPLSPLSQKGAQISGMVRDYIQKNPGLFKHKPQQPSPIVNTPEGYTRNSEYSNMIRRGNPKMASGDLKKYYGI